MHSLRWPRSALSTPMLCDISRSPLQIFPPGNKPGPEDCDFPATLVSTRWHGDRIGILSLAKEILPKSCPRLPCVGIFRESIAPKRFFIVKNFGALPRVCSHHSSQLNGERRERTS